MNHKCPNCGERISLYWLFVENRAIEFKCKKCQGVIRKTSRYKKIGIIAGGLSGAGGVYIMRTILDQYHSYRIAITALIVYGLALVLALNLLMPGLLQFVPKIDR
jgi:predicted RNA-binding Zn-ribbon protein involved in translation (DUF1610 family)